MRGHGIALEPDWPRALVYLLFFVLGAATVGWNGVFHAECARLSPPGMASLVAGGTSFFVFSGSLIGPAAFAAYAFHSYAFNFAAAATFRHYGLLAPVLVRLGNYAVWHVLYGNFLFS